jgi:NitT/TauT family transport system permease protein
MPPDAPEPTGRPLILTAMAGAASRTVIRRAPARRAEPVAASSIPRRKRLAGYLAIVAGLFAAWEGVKWLAGDVWRLQGSVLGVPIDYVHTPPFDLRIASDLSLPHVWDIVGTFFEPAQRNGPPLLTILIGAAAFTFQEAFVGFAIGAFLGLALAILFVHARSLERALVPYVVASQTVPIVAIAPIVVIFLRAGWLSVAVIAAYLTFFPVTIAALRGLRSADPRAFELFRSYGASRRQVLWKLRLPASTPYLFAALRISASASVVGAIIGELPSGIPDGLGGAILNFKQYYVSGPERLWATIIVAAVLGLIFVGLVRLAESVVTHGRYRAVET